MNNSRFSRWFDGGSQISDSLKQPLVRGFTVNPFGDSITPAQVQMYQAAFLQAKKELEEPEWPMAECWN